ncbi:hypothetical protein SISSUDRAFT_1118870 [Sistotremastrum suecicum HHB10207 ss-3]|uniref:Uncharacterized protein n=1 Tax=Sistotremastrum suecicum HHB10207 ss-3 TaxID=1314776 RepID=A0A166EFJ6_9AGAM|nr:hypothetical protein SISSUDRAFT_1118870 [Sistotremastrum suecicum HHB10207 ss-3]
MLPPLDGLSTSFGLVMIGVLASSLMNGFITFQSIVYFRNCSEDPWTLRFMVIGLMLLEFLHLGFCWHFQWFYFNAAFVDTNLLVKSVWVSKADCPYYVPCGSFVSLLLYRQTVEDQRTFSTGLRFHRRVGIGNFGNPTNVYNQTVSTAILAQHKHRIESLYDSHTRTRSVQRHRHSVWVVLLSAQVSNRVSTYLGLPESLAYLAVFEVLSKVYVIAILTSLNNRSELRTQCRTGDLEMYRDQISSPLRPSPLRTPLSGRSWPGITSPYKAETPQSPLKKFIRNSESGDATSPFPVIRIEKTIESHTDDEIFGRGATKSTTETDTASNGSSPENF